MHDAVAGGDGEAEPTPGDEERQGPAQGGGIGSGPDQPGRQQNGGKPREEGQCQHLPVVGEFVGYGHGAASTVDAG
jgi:hypothetical protein